MNHTTIIERPMHQIMEMSDPEDTLIASNTPVNDLERLSWPGQHSNRRLYRPGYERYMNAMPRLLEKDPFEGMKVQAIMEVFQELRREIEKDAWYKDVPVLPGDLTRTIVAMEKPEIIDGELIGGPMIVVAKFAKGMVLPVHKHPTGFMYEEIIDGRFLETHYRLVCKETKTVRPIKTVVMYAGEIGPHSDYEGLIHSEIFLQETNTILYIPHNPRDARGNIGYTVQHFSDHYCLAFANVKNISLWKFADGKVGDVALIKSDSHEFGNHYIIKTGENSYERISTTQIKELATLENGTYKLRQSTAENFLHFHGIEIVSGKVIFPKP